MVHSGLIIPHESGYSGHNRPPETFLVDDFPLFYPSNDELSIMSLSLSTLIRSWCPHAEGDDSDHLVVQKMAALGAAPGQSKSMNFFR
jgi:hypothetical protein